MLYRPCGSTNKEVRLVVLPFLRATSVCPRYNFILLVSSNTLYASNRHRLQQLGGLRLRVDLFRTLAGLHVRCDGLSFDFELRIYVRVTHSPPRRVRLVYGDAHSTCRYDKKKKTLDKKKSLGVCCLLIITNTRPFPDRNSLKAQ